jgi:tetratricopeptide (TPR) repeat protein
LQYSKNRIAYYRDRCLPPLTQTVLAQAVGKHLNTIQNWESKGAPSPADLQRLVEIFVARGALRSYDDAVSFWEVSGREREPFPLPPELRHIFERSRPEDAGLLPRETLPNHAALPAGSRIPLYRNRLFTGRGGDLLALAAALDPPDSTVVVSGMAGIGKTQLACEFVHRYGQFFSGGVFWISFADPAAVPAAIAACGDMEYLNLLPDFDALPLDKQVRLVLAAWRHAAPRLLVFDNCEEEVLLAEWRPPTGGCRVLVTSRRVRWSPSLVASIRALRVLERADSVALLGGYGAGLPAAAGFAGAAHKHDLDLIAEELGDLPLGLHLAGSHLAYRWPELTPARYLADLREASTRAGSVARVLDATPLSGAVSPTRHQQQLVSALALSYARLNPGDPTGALALRLLARAAHFAAGEPIRRSLLGSTVVTPTEAAKQRARVENALAQLSGDLGLLEASGDQTVRMHRLVAGFAREADDGEAQADVERAVLAEAHRVNEQRLPAPMRELQAHLRSITGAALEREDARAAELCAALGWQLVLLSAPDDAEPYLRRALAIRENVLGARHPATAASLNLLGLMHQWRAELAPAQHCFEQALWIWEQALDPGAIEIGQACNNLGALLMVRDDLISARRYLDRALAIAETQRGAEHLDVARNLTNLGYLLVQASDYAAAQPYLERALAIREHALPAQHPATAQTLNNLGDLLHNLQRYDEAWAYHQRALAMRQAVFGRQHNDTAESLKNLGRVLLARGDYAGAETHLEESLAICETVLGADHIETAWSLSLLGDLFYAQGRFDAAGRLVERALAIYSRQLGEDHRDTRGARARLAELGRR